MKNKREHIRDWLRRSLALMMALVMVITMLPLHVFADDFLYDHMDKEKSGFINKLPVEPAKPEDGKTATELITNPDMPAIYTLRTDYKVQRGDKYEVNYQPYIASVGEAATEEEKAKVNQTVKLPDLTGYEKPDDDYLITYDKVKNAGNNGSQEFRYKSKANAITIKHVFQDLHDFSKYTNPDGSVGDKGQLITTQNGNTGSTMEVSPLNENERRGFVPEAPFITMQVPENAENFILEYRYNRAHYNVNFDTKGGTPVPDRTLYYEQIIPTIDDKSIPTKAGCDFLGWKPSHDLQTADGKTYKKDQIINKADGTPSFDLDVQLKMPALLLGLDEKSREKLTFTAVWKEKPKAEYVIQFWTEKADYDDKDDTLPLRDRYDFIGARRIDDADTGSSPNLTNLDIHGITFPDLNDGRLEKAQNSKEEFERYYFLNEGLTKKQNASEKDPNVQKSVSSTGETVYNVYYNRRVYTLYFTSINDYNDPWAYWPIITRNGQVLGKEGDPYKVNVRFNQSLDKIWPKDEEVSGLPKGYTSEPTGDDGLIGWTINNNVPFLIFRDTPPYRLSAEDFIDPEDVLGTGEVQGHGHADKIPIGKNKEKDRGEYEISLGASYYDVAMAYHIDIIKDDFNGKEQIDYDLSYWKSDTNTYDYEFILPHLQGFTLKKETRPAILIGKIKVDDVEKTFDELNAERNEKTPFRSDADKIEYISHFPWSEKLFNGTNAYDYANYYRNKYKLKLNNDPKTVKNDSEYGAGNILDVPYEYPLNDLKLDTTHKPQKPDWVRDDWSFLGWALDPAGDNLVKDGKETKLHYDQVLYAKWGEPDYKWKVIFDPNGGSLRSIDENKLTTERKTVKEGDIGQEIETTYPIKEKSEGDKQVFKVFHKQKLVEPSFKPVRKGYDFMGWEIIRYKKDATTGDYTDVIDTSYRDTYKVPELYSFGNDVVSPIYLKAIWVPNARVDVKVLHYYLDKDYNLDKNISPNPDSDTLENKRADYLVATTGDRQDDKYTLVPHDELNEKLTGDLKTIYEEYNDRVGLNNSFFQTFRVEPEKIDDGNGNLIDNPNLKNNVFKFFYRPYRQREYKVNYIDERAKAAIEAETDPAKKAKLIKNNSIIRPEAVTNGNRHYDARNYRPIPGWVLTSDPQQQLFFDVNEETNEFLGINGTDSDEITFYYKDVRVIEVPEGGKTPDGYVRVTFKADKGGSFGKDAQGNDITELHYDVIKGLKSDLLPVPQELKEGETADANKHYITPDEGKKFTKWDNKPLLNKNTIINEAHTFTAYFEWSGLTAKGMVRTEAFKDPNNTWTNDFAPKLEDLKKQLVWKEKDQVKPLPTGTTIKLFDEAGKELTSDDQVYDLVNEKKAADKDELVRTVNIKAKVTFTDGKEPQELDIPITVYKNVYEALNKEGDKPLFLKEAEGKKAEEGGLSDVTGNYVKVTVKASKDFDAKDDKIYYVNKNAWVEIPEVKTEGSSTFVNWKADKDAQNENGIFDFGKRHKFTENTVISPSDAKDVVEQTDPNKKPDVPNNYVKVIVKTTDKATDDTKFEKTFWVNPTTEVAIDVTNPTGKTVAADPAKVGAVGYTMKFSKWESTETTARVWEDKIVGKFEKDTTIVAKYSVTPEVIKPIVPTTDTVHTPQGKTPTVDQIKDKITPPEGKTISKVTIVENPNVTEPGDSKVKVIVEYTDGSSVGTNDNPVVIPVEVHEKIIPAEPGGKKPEGALDNYVKVIFTAGEGGSLSGDLVYYVSPEVEVDMTESAKAVTKKADIGYFVKGEKWTNTDGKTLKGTFKDPETEFVFNFEKSEDIVEKTDDPNQEIPKGYVTVTFKTEDENKGKLEGDVKEKIYYVNPKADIKLVELTGDQTAGDKQLAVPKTAPAANYEFEGWYEEIDQSTTITSERIHVAKFKLAKVTLTYDKGGEDVTGDVPKELEVDHGTKVRLAGPGDLKKDNAVFAGWKIGNDTYKVGDEVTLNENTTAIAQWKVGTHTVMFNSMGGTNVETQVVNHGDKLKAFDAPTLDGKVFMGWKERVSGGVADSFFNLETAITADKVLVAQWQEPVQKIGESGNVEEQFIKVTFLKGNHGTLKDGQAENLDKVIYKVAKDYTFDQAKEKGLVVPGIVPAKYYKVKAENSGWDKALVLDKQDITITAQYEPMADVIPVDPKVTPDDKLQEDKPEGMVLVEFVVPADKAFMTGNTKFYVKANTRVDIPTPVVHPLTLENNEINNYEFNGWNFEKDEGGNYKFIFNEDTTINDGNVVKPEITIRRPRPNDRNVIIVKMTDGAIGYLEVTRGSNAPVIIESSSKGNRSVFEIPVELNGKLNRNDRVKVYSKVNGIESDIREYRVR